MPKPTETELTRFLELKTRINKWGYQCMCRNCIDMYASMTCLSCSKRDGEWVKCHICGDIRELAFEHRFFELPDDEMCRK